MKKYQLNKAQNKYYRRLKEDREYLHVVNAPQAVKLQKKKKTGIRKKIKDKINYSKRQPT